MNKTGQNDGKPGQSCNSDRDILACARPPSEGCPGVPGDMPGRDIEEAGRDIGEGDTLSVSPATDVEIQAPAGGPASHAQRKDVRQRYATDRRFAAWIAGATT